MEQLEDQRTRRAAAAGACRVMEPVAKRKLRKEIQKARTPSAQTRLIERSVMVYSLPVWSPR